MKCVLILVRSGIKLPTVTTQYSLYRSLYQYVNVIHRLKEADTHSFISEHQQNITKSDIITTLHEVERVNFKIKD